MRIAVDAMGGDNAPEQIIKGALAAAEEIQGELLLIGQTEKMAPFLPKQLPTNVQIIHASQVVEMDDSPVKTAFKKRDSSLVVGAQLVKDGKADALVTVGNTGAAVATCKILWNMVPGIDRPALATVLPTLKGNTILLDSGATTDCEPEWLLQFAIMGQALSSQVWGVKEPRVALLSIGEERGKGNLQVKKAFELIEGRLPNFTGNIEGKDIFIHPVDVVVCDGFVGNVLLKTGEGVIQFLFTLLKDALPQSKLLKLPLLLYRRPLKRLQKRLDYAEYGGAPLLGVNGICIIGHGRSDARAVRSAIVEASRAVGNNLLATIERSIKQTEMSNV